LKRLLDKDPSVYTCGLSATPSTLYPSVWNGLSLTLQLFPSVHSDQSW